MFKRITFLVLAVLFATSPAVAAKKALFDNAHAEQAGQADWVIDDNQPVPSPAQSGIGPATLQTYWTGGISAYGVALVKRGYTVATNTAAFTYGNTGNTYDLANYDVLIIPEPNSVFTAAEITAIRSFVQNGGGLVAISDHSGSDRNSDGQDSPMIFNALDPTWTLFGAHFGVSGDANNNIVQTSTNVNASASDSVTHGPMGTVAGLAFHNGTTLTFHSAANSTVRGEVWMTGLAQTSTTGVMAASARYGSGRVVMICDSSPLDDGSGTSGNTLYNGWGEAGATDSTLFVNGAMWATRGTVTGDATPPVVAITSPVGGETWKASSSHAITWTATDNVGVTAVDLAYSTDGGATYPNTIATSLANSGTYTWTVPNVTGTTVRVRVTARDAAANSASAASATNFTIDKWILTASAGANGTISPTGAVQVAQAGSQAFTIAANTGYHVASVLVDAVSVGAVTTYTFSNVTANHTIAATFAVNATYTLTASAGANGTISPAGAVVVSSGGSQAFTIAASTGYHVADVLVDAVSVGAVATYTFSNVTANHTIAASFAVNTTTYTITASAGANGTISPTGAVVVTAGNSQAFTITAGSGYHVASVLVDGASVGAVTTYTFTNVQTAHTIAASFSNATNTPYSMASGNYLESFGDIANWANNFASGVGASCWAAVAVQGSGTIPDGIHTTTSTATFTTGSTGGVQKGVSPNPTGTIVLLSTGTTDNSTADAIDLFLDFTGRIAGTLGYGWATVFNSTGDRKGSLRVYTSVDGATFTELTGAASLNFTNNVTGSGTISSVALPATFNNAATARLRFYYCNGTGGTTGSRPKVAIDNVAVTSTASGASAQPAVEEPAPFVDLLLALAPSQPNPSNGVTTLGFTLPRAGHAQLQIVDLGGRQVWDSEGEFSAGSHAVRWDGRTASGAQVPAGVYFVRLVTADGSRGGRLVKL